MTTDLRAVTLQLLRAAGVSLQDEHQLSYRLPVPAELKSFFPGRAVLHFTFDEEYYDLHNQEGVEFVAPGYPLLNGLIRYAQSRMLASESELEALHSPPPVTSHTLQVHQTPEQVGATYVGFYIKISFRTHELNEEVIPIWVNLANYTVLSELPQGKRKGLTTPSALDPAIVNEAWQRAQQHSGQILTAALARYEEAANLKLANELRRLQSVNASQDQQQRLKQDSALQVNSELIFAEIVHYPTHNVRVQYNAKKWQRVHLYRFDAVRGQWIQPPTCPVCRQSTLHLEGCDKAQHVVCPNCQTECSHCGAHHCSHHPTTPCNTCQRGHCVDCLGECHSCHSANCPTCQRPCPDCQKATCDDCFMDCEVCRHHACKDHYAQCHLTGVKLCSAHSPRCQGCHKVAHPDLIHQVDGGAHLCEACVVTCAEPHPLPRWLIKAAPTCGGQHPYPHHLCREHSHRCAKHPQHGVYCQAHVAACAECGDRLCEQHQKRSQRNGQVYCDIHSHDCPSCNRNVGKAETILTVEGHRVCQDCAQRCPACNDNRRPWTLHTLRPCPICVLLANKSGLLKRHQDLQQFKRLNPTVVRCPDHYRVCHVCSRATCHDHLVPCGVCGKDTCLEHIRSTVEAVKACTQCVRQCQHCPPNRLHIPRAMASCTVCQKEVCPEHRGACSVCKQPTCHEHLHPSVEGEMVCSNCAHYCKDCASHHHHLPQAMECCGVCSGEICVEHRAKCRVCQRPTCADHMRMTEEGLAACTGCTRQCKHCAPEKHHLPQAMQACNVCGTEACGSHRQQCGHCLGHTCKDHVQACTLCGEPTCVTCAKGTLCPCCATLAPTVTLPSEVPLSGKPILGWIMRSDSIRSDGVKLSRVVYYQAYPTTWGLWLSPFDPPVPRLDVLELGPEGWKRKATKAISNTNQWLRPFNLWEYAANKRRKP